ncbi:hypothetical protein [Adhaeribacter rhizoryzae]|uniref:Uncharacterized protein n=1 Tax=Adhaeribacter rhizoryzae TaxID=2607907 RepID=A0A5M6DQB5_9BACT|nr:hypothetical protein [Adhaeribacter rhizoryzae]KAA5548432.1 hypothetical protein F0145_06815 [Adhaeribacter rhizoryzae]
MLKTFTQILNRNNEPHFLLVLLIWISIGLETHLWWQISFYGAALLTALVGYSLLFYVLPALSNKIEQRAQ